MTELESFLGWYEHIYLPSFNAPNGVAQANLSVMVAAISSYKNYLKERKQ